MERQTILVTGGAGFLGSHLCERLVELGADVLCLDNFFSGSRENIEHLLSQPNFELLRHDVVEPMLLEADQIFNLACPGSPVHFQRNAVKTVKTCVMGSIHVLEMAWRCKVRVVHASAQEVYGDAEEHPQKESYRGRVNPIGERSCHDEGKRVAETLMMDYKVQRGLDVGIARIFNTYGPRMAFNDGRVVSQFITAALQNQPLVVYGDGSQTRSFCYVSDMVEALVRLMGKGGFAGPVNLGNPREVTIKDLAQTIIRLCGSKSEIRQAPALAYDPARRRPDIELAKSTLAWEPDTDLEQGLKQTISYFKKKMS